jgi:hypothetical protein
MCAEVSLNECAQGDGHGVSENYERAEMSRLQ